MSNAGPVTPEETRRYVESAWKLIDASRTQSRSYPLVWHSLGVALALFGAGMHSGLPGVLLVLGTWMAFATLFDMLADKIITDISRPRR